VSRTKKFIATALTSLALLGGTSVFAATPAQAHTCRGEVYWNAGGGGCSSEGRRTRLAVQCQVIGSYFTYTVRGAWFDRYVSWWDVRYCNSSSRATKSYIEWE
jgi:hypothetical protein